MGYATAPTHNPGETIPSADWNILAGDINSGLVRMLADALLAVDAASITLASIPATFAHLLLVAYARTDEAILASGFTLRFNNDSGANYDYQATFGSAVTQTVVEALAQTQTLAGSSPGASAAANLFGAADIVIPHYAGSANNKSYVSKSAMKGGTASGNMRAMEIAGFWRSNAAINQINILPGAGTNLKAGTRVTLYGMPF